MASGKLVILALTLSLVMAGSSASPRYTVIVTVASRGRFDESPLPETYRPADCILGDASQPKSTMSRRISLGGGPVRHDYSEELTKGWPTLSKLAPATDASQFVEFRPLTGRLFELGEDPLVTVGGGNLLLRYRESGLYLAQSDGGAVDEESIRRTVSMIRRDAARTGTRAEVVDLGGGSFGILAITADLAGVEFGVRDLYATLLVERDADGSGMCLALELARAAMIESLSNQVNVTEAQAFPR